MTKNSLPTPRADLEDIYLYHGSLAEINSRNPRTQYIFTQQRSFVYVSDEKNIEDAEEETRRALFLLRYSGLVNKKTSAICLVSGYVTGDGIEPVTDVKFIIEGTPIVRLGGSA